MSDKATASAHDLRMSSVAVHTWTASNPAFCLSVCTQLVRRAAASPATHGASARQTINDHTHVRPSDRQYGATEIAGVDNVAGTKKQEWTTQNMNRT